MRRHEQPMKRVLASLAVGITILLGGALVAYQRGTAQAASSASTGELAAIEKKLDALLADHTTILQKLEAVMEELRVIKVRATR